MASDAPDSTNHTASTIWWGRCCFWVELWVEPQMLCNASGIPETPASDLSRRYEALRSLLGGELEMRFGGNSIEGSNPSLSASPLTTMPSAG